MAASPSRGVNRPLRFVLVGVVNALSGLSVIYVLKFLAGANDTAANLIGYSVGLSISMILNGRWTFAYRGNLRATVPRFIAVVAIAYLANLIVVTSAIRLWDVNSYVAQALGVGPYSLLSYFGFKHFTYRQAIARDGNEY